MSTATVTTPSFAAMPALLPALTPTLSHAMRAAMVLDGRLHSYTKWPPASAASESTGRLIVPLVDDVMT